MVSGNLAGLADLRGRVARYPDLCFCCANRSRGDSATGHALSGSRLDRGVGSGDHLLDDGRDAAMEMGWKVIVL